MKLFQDVQVKEKTDCILWYAEGKTPTKILWKFHEKYRRHSNALNNKTILNGFIGSRKVVPSANRNANARDNNTL